MVRILLVDVLERVPRSIHGPQILIAHPFHVLNGVLVETGFPKPIAETVRGRLAAEALIKSFSAGERSLAQINSPRTMRKRQRPRRLHERHREGIRIFAYALDLK